MFIQRFVKLYIKKRLWRKNNPLNDTYIVNAFDLNYIKVGRYTYGPLDVEIGNNFEKLYIGEFCSIADKVKFLLSVEHEVNTISTYPFKAKFGDEFLSSTSKGDIIVDDDVWIGYGATIMSGVHIGQGAVVAAGAVVTKDVPPYAIVGGVPAKVIRYRFEPEMIDELQKVDYSKLTKEDIEKHIDDLYTELKDPSQLDWMPRKQSRDMGESRRE